jgi:hypothetical protein
MKNSNIRSGRNRTLLLDLTAISDESENIVSNNVPIVVGVFTDPLTTDGLPNPVILLRGLCCGLYLATAAVYIVTA